MTTEQLLQTDRSSPESKTSRDFIRDVFALLLGRIPPENIIEERLSQSNFEVAKRCITAPEFSEKALARYLTREFEKKQASSITFEASFINLAVQTLLQQEYIKSVPSNHDETLSWLDAFELFLYTLHINSPTFLAEETPDHENIRLYFQSLDIREKVDRYVASGDFVRAYLASSRAVKAGLRSLLERQFLSAILLGVNFHTLYKLRDPAHTAIGKHLEYLFSEQFSEKDYGSEPAITALSSEIVSFFLLPDTFKNALLSVRSSSDFPITTAVTSLIEETNENIQKPITLIDQSEKGRLCILSRNKEKSIDQSLISLDREVIHHRYDTPEELEQLPEEPGELKILLNEVQGDELQFSPLELDIVDVLCDWNPAVQFRAENEIYEIRGFDFETIEISGPATDPIAVATKKSKDDFEYIHLRDSLTSTQNDYLNELDSTTLLVRTQSREQKYQEQEAPQEAPQEALGAITVLNIDLRTNKETDHPQVRSTHYCTLGTLPVLNFVYLDIENGNSCEDVLKMINRHQLDAGTPVLLLTDDFQYAPDYAEALTLQFLRFGGMQPLSLRRLEFNTDAKLELRSSTSIRDSFASPLSCSIAPLHIVLEALQAQSEIPVSDTLLISKNGQITWSNPADILIGDGLPLIDRIIVEPYSLQRIHSARNNSIRELRNSDRVAGLLATSLAHRSADKARLVLLNQLVDATSADGNDLKEKIEAVLKDEQIDKFSELMNYGHGEQVCEFVVSCFRSPEVLTVLSLTAFSNLINLVQAAALQQVISNIAKVHAWQIVSKEPRKITSLYTLFASGLTQEDFYSVCSASIVRAFEGRLNTRRCIRLLDVFTRFASPEVVKLTALLIDEMAPDFLKKNENTHMLLGRALLGNYTELVFPNSGVDLEALAKAVSPKSKVIEAVACGDREQLLRLLRGYSESGTPLRDLIEWLRPYTFEVSQLNITAVDWRYNIYSSAPNVMRMACILRDKNVITYLLPEIDDPELQVIANAAIGNLDELNSYYAKNAKNLGLSSLSFKGENNVELFRHFSSQATGTRLDTPSGSPLVSVVMTVFDPDLDLLDLAIQSVLNQTVEDIELFLIDDLSEPGIGSKIADLASIDARIRYFAFPSNCGPYVGRNFAIDRAKGKFIAIQDGDDYSHPQRLEKQLSLFDQYKFLQGCASNHIRFDANALPQMEHGFSLLGDGTMSSVFRRTVFDEIGGFIPSRSRGDVEFRERLKGVYGPAAFYQISEPLIFCNSTPSTLSHTINRQKREHLQELRVNLSRRSWDYTQDIPTPLHDLAIPFGLRAKTN
ncbi:glycosyltransferase family 2 protein [Ponticaulis profundi]|uniref:Glycosyltransferase family 2 protein n=1 Tax=Ponticaulis profundi TaxID=2665222 RepID=A0ABW1SEF8_9PROT